MEEIVNALAKLPGLLSQVLETQQEAQTIAKEFFNMNSFLYLGRGINYPMAMEGALKLKEISYIHAEGYQAGEMKHGPIALIDSNMPVIAISLADQLYPKMLNNIEEVKSRDGKVIAIATHGDDYLASRADHIIYLPSTPYLLSPIITIVPLQFFAYQIAILRGCNVDQPRNLAKSVTVE